MFRDEAYEMGSGEGNILSLTLVMMGGLQTLVMMRGGSKCPPPFLFVKTIEKVIRLCTVLKKNYLIGSFKDKAIFRVILEIDR